MEIKLNGLDLFSGIGGNSLALSPWIKTVAYCEGDRHAQSVLLSRMVEGDLLSAPIWDDVRTLRSEHLGVEPIDIIVAGFPCQDISVAGTGKGLDGERSGLFFEICRLAKEIKPTFLFLENVPGIRTRGLDTVVRTLSELGFSSKWTIISAAETGACHLRERWFLLAYADSVRLREECGEKIGRNNSKRERSLEPNSSGETGGTSWASKRLSKPGVGGTGDGLSHRVDRHKRLGNSVVPAQAQKAFKELMGLQ